MFIKELSDMSWLVHYRLEVSTISSITTTSNVNNLIVFHYCTKTKYIIILEISTIVTVVLVVVVVMVYR